MPDIAEKMYTIYGVLSHLITLFCCKFFDLCCFVMKSVLLQIINAPLREEKSSQKLCPWINQRKLTRWNSLFGLLFCFLIFFFVFCICPGITLMKNYKYQVRRNFLGLDNRSGRVSMIPCHLHWYGVYNTIVLRFTLTLFRVLGLGHLLFWLSLTARGRLFKTSDKINANIAHIAMYLYCSKKCFHSGRRH